MKAQSADYIQLQNVYRAKARKDFSEVLTIVRQTEKRLGREDNPIEEKEVEAFCKGAGFIKLLRGKSFSLARHIIGDGWGDRARFACRSSSIPFLSRWLSLRV